MWMQTNWGLHCSPPQQRLCSGKWFPSCQPVASSYISQQKPSPTTQRRKSAWPGPLTEPMKQHMIKKCCWEKDTFLYIEWEAHRTRAANRHHKQRTTLTKHLENCLQVGKVVSRYDPVKYRSDCPACSTGEGTWIESCSRVYQYPTRSEWRKQFMSGLRKKLDSLGTEMGLMEMMLAVYID